MSPLPSGSCDDVCIYSGYDGDEADFHESTIVRARVEHRCCECNEIIPRGDRYERAKGKWDGQINTFETCLACVECRRAFCCDGWVYGMLWEAAEESMFESMTTGCLDKLESAAAKDKLLQRWRRWKGLS